MLLQKLVQLLQVLGLDDHQPLQNCGHYGARQDRHGLTPETKSHPHDGDWPDYAIVCPRGVPGTTGTTGATGATTSDHQV